MKTVLSLLMLSISTTSFAQNLKNNSAIQQQTNQFNNVMVQNNNVGTFTNVQQGLNSPINVPKPTIYIPGNVNRRRIYGDPNGTGFYGPNGTSNPIAMKNNVLDNVGENEMIQKTKQEREPSQLSLNIEVSLPSINLNRVKEEKRIPKRLDDFRIKTGNGSSSSGSYHTWKKSKNATFKKVVKSIKYCWRKNFKKNIKFQSSNDCFLF